MLWRNTCPYIPSPAKSRWPPSHSEQTTVKLQNKNKYKKKKQTDSEACSLSGHSSNRRRRTELRPGTYSLLFRLQSSGVWKKTPLPPPPSAVLPRCGGQRWRKERAAPFQPFLSGVKKDKWAKFDSTCREAVDLIQPVLKLIKIRANLLCQNE